jgi:NAD(P)H-hydrate epimerase
MFAAGDYRMDFPVMQVTDLPIVSAGQMAEIDRIMIEEIGLALLQMMENADRNLAEVARSMLGGSLAGRQVAILTGPGHNGGGGLVAARHLSNGGAAVDVILAADRAHLKPATVLQLGILDKMEIRIRPSSVLRNGTYTLLVDALLGYSTAGPPRGMIAALITAAEESGIPVLSLDLPSGLDPDSGRLMRPHIAARTTLTLAVPKTGLLEPEAHTAVGDLYVGDIGVPGGVYVRLGLTSLKAMFATGPIVRVARQAANNQ